MIILFLYITVVTAKSNFFFVESNYQARTGTDSTAEVLQQLIGDKATTAKLTIGRLSTAQDNFNCGQSSLAGLFAWPNASYGTDHYRDAMLSLVGESHDYLILVPNLNLYKVYEYIFEGVKAFAAIANEKTTVLLLIPSTASAEQRDALFMVGSATNIGVLAGDLVKKKIGTQISGMSTSLIGAATVYSYAYDSKISDSESAVSTLLSTHQLSEEQITSLSDAALSIVRETKRGDLPETIGESSPKGQATWFVNLRPRTLRLETWGSSTESGIRGQLIDLLNKQKLLGGMRLNNLGNTGKSANQVSPLWKGTLENPSDVMLKRSMAFGPGPDDYFPTENELGLYHVWMKFDYQYDKGDYGQGTFNIQCMDQSYFGSSDNAIKKVIPMINDGQKANFFPMRYFIAREKLSAPQTIVQRDSQHLSEAYLEGVSSGMLTLITGGRCFVGDEPLGKTENDALWQNWHARKTGYELAYEFATLQMRSPCFEIIVEENDIISTNSTATVRFNNDPPQAPVIVSVVSSHPDYIAIASEQIIIFSVSNYNQIYPVVLVNSGIAPPDTEVKVMFSTSSADSVFDSLTDVWSYKTGEQFTSNSCKKAPLGAISITNNEKPGSVATYSCETSEGSIQLTCTNGKWVGSSLNCAASPTSSPTSSPNSSPNSSPAPTTWKDLGPLNPTSAPTIDVFEGNTASMFFPNHVFLFTLFLFALIL